jgi:hypothetical protein
VAHDCFPDEVMEPKLSYIAACPGSQPAMNQTTSSGLFIFPLLAALERHFFTHLAALSSHFMSLAFSQSAFVFGASAA